MLNNNIFLLTHGIYNLTHYVKWQYASYSSYCTQGTYLILVYVILE